MKNRIFASLMILCLLAGMFTFGTAAEDENAIFEDFTYGVDSDIIKMVYDGKMSATAVTINGNPCMLWNPTDSSKNQQGIRIAYPFVSGHSYTISFDAYLIDGMNGEKLSVGYLNPYACKDPGTGSKLSSAYDFSNNDCVNIVQASESRYFAAVPAGKWTHFQMTTTIDSTQTAVFSYLVIRDRNLADDTNLQYPLARYFIDNLVMMDTVDFEEEYPNGVPARTDVISGLKLNFEDAQQPFYCAVNPNNEKAELLEVNGNHVLGLVPTVAGQTWNKFMTDYYFENGVSYTLSFDAMVAGSYSETAENHIDANVTDGTLVPLISSSYYPWDWAEPQMFSVGGAGVTVKAGEWTHYEMTITPNSSTKTTFGFYENPKNDNNTCFYVDNLILEKTSDYKKATYVGAQTATKENVNDLRFVATINTLDLQSVGFDVTASYTPAGGELPVNKDFSGNCTFVYQKLLGNVDGTLTEYTAQSLNGCYIYALTVKNIPTSVGTVTFRVTPYVIDKNEVKTSSQGFDVTLSNAGANGWTLFQTAVQ